MTRGSAQLPHRRGALVAAVAVGLLAGCRGEPSYAVDRVVVGETAAMRSLGGLGIPGETLGAAASRLLEKTPGFVAPEAASRGSRRFLGQLSVDRAEIRASGGAGASTAAHVAVTLTLEPVSGGSTLRETGTGSSPIGSGSEGLRTALERAGLSAVEAAVASLALQRSAEQRKTSELIRDLGSADASVRDHATRVLAARGERDAFPALLARLRDSDPVVRERAVGALAQLRDPRTVPSLIEATHRRDASYVANMARIIGDIGGPDANAWLLTMAWGHPDEVVRTAARDALADMSARELHARVQR